MRNVRRVPRKLHLRTSVWACRLSAVSRDPDQGEIGCSLKEKFLFTAFRFFTEPARKRNRTALSRETTINMDQRGCIHVNMDLYRFCYKIAPWIESELLVDAFELARFAREIDMRASPYDRRSIGFAPIRVETPDGRAEYVRLQRKISERAKPIRQRVLLAYQRLWDGFR
jgi:hypothetical protein